MWVDLDQICTPVWPRPDLRSRSRSWSFQSCKNCTFLRLISSAVLARTSKVTGGGDSMGPGLQLGTARFLNFLLGKLSWEFKLWECQYFTKFKWPYFSSVWCYIHTVGHAGSPARTVYVDLTLTRCKVKVTDLLNFKKLRKLHISRSISSAIFASSPNWWLAVIVWDLVYSLLETDFRISF